jgi:hypothetical protein
LISKLVFCEMGHLDSRQLDDASRNFRLRLCGGLSAFLTLPIEYAHWAPGGEGECSQALVAFLNDSIFIVEEYPPVRCRRAYPDALTVVYVVCPIGQQIPDIL